MGRIDAKGALITGSAQGLELADTQVLAREGARVVMTDIQDGAGESAAAETRETGGDAIFLRQDVSSEEARWEEVIQDIKDRYGRLDVPVNNAGLVRMATPEEFSLGSFRVHNAAKGAVRSMSKAVTVHCRTNGHNSRVNSLHPGAIDTPMIDQTSSALGLENKADISPVGLDAPEDVANVVLFLASDESRYVNGSEIVIGNVLCIH